MLLGWQCKLYLLHLGLVSLKFVLKSPLNLSELDEVQNFTSSSALYSKLHDWALKYDNLQYNILGRWVDGMNVWCSKQFFFSIISYRLKALKNLYFHFCKFMKKNLKQFLQRILQEIMVDESFAPVKYIEDCWIFEVMQKVISGFGNSNQKLLNKTIYIFIFWSTLP